MHTRSILILPRLFLGFILLAVLTISFMPTSANAEEIGDTIMVSKPYYEWAIEIPNISNGYERRNYSSTYDILHFLKPTIDIEGHVVSQHFYFDDKSVDVSVFVLRETEPTTNELCIDHYFNASDESVTGSWKKEKIAHSEWQKISRSIDFESYNMEWQQGIVRGLDEFCFAVIAEVKKGADSEDYEVVDSLINETVLHTSYTRTVNDYILYGELWNPDGYIKAFDLALKEEKVYEKEFFDDLLYKASHKHIQWGYYPFAQVILRHIYRADRSDPMPLYGLGLTYYSMGDEKTGERFLKRAFSRQFGLKSFTLASDEMKDVYDRFRTSFLEQYGKDVFYLRDVRGVLWNEWISEYDFSPVEKIDWIEYFKSQHSQIELNPETCAKCQDYMAVGPFQNGRAIARDWEGNWFYIDPEGEVTEGESPLDGLGVELLQAIGPGGMPCPEILFGFTNPNDPLCGVMQQDLENSIVR